MDESYFSSFSNDAENVLAQAALTPTDRQYRENVCENIRRVARSVPAVALEFGSFATQLATKSSDIDIAIKVPSDVFEKRVEEFKKEPKEQKEGSRGKLPPRRRATVSFLKEMLTNLCPDRPTNSGGIQFSLACVCILT